MGIVDLFEAIEIHHQQGQGVAFPACACQFFLEHLQDGVAIEQAGKTIVGGLFAQGFARGQELLLQLQNAAPGAQAHPQLVGLKRLGEIVVGAGLHTFHQIFGIRARGEQQDVHVGFAAGGAHPAADIHTVQTGHHPVENCQLRPIGLLQGLPRLIAIAGDYRLIAPLGEHVAEHRLKDGVVFRHQHLHGMFGVSDSFRHDGQLQIRKHIPSEVAYRRHNRGQESTKGLSEITKGPENPGQCTGYRARRAKGAISISNWLPSLWTIR